MSVVYEFLGSKSIPSNQSSNTFIELSGKLEDYDFLILNTGGITDQSSLVAWQKVEGLSSTQTVYFYSSASEGRYLMQIYVQPNYSGNKDAVVARNNTSNSSRTLYVYGVKAE